MSSDGSRLTLLLHENAQVSELIGRAQSTSNTLFGAVLPVAGSVLLFAVKTDQIHLPLEYLGLYFAAIVALAIIYNAGLWLEMSRYTRYKYLVIFPAMYQEVGFNGKASLGHFLAQEHLKRTDWLTIAFHAIAFMIAFVVSSTSILNSCAARSTIVTMLAAASVLLGSALVADFWVAVQVMAALREVRNAAPDRPA